MRPREALERLLPKVLEQQEQSGNGSVVDRLAIERGALEASKDERDVSEEALQVISAFRQPKYLYDGSRRAYVRDTRDRPLHASADAKISMYRERLGLIRQRLGRNDMFTPPPPGAAAREYLELTPLESLGGLEGRAVTVLGMLSRREDGEMTLEDESGSVALDLELVDEPDIAVCETCVVLCDGRMGGDKFAVELMGLPPAEARLDSLLAMGVVDPFGILRTPQDYDTSLRLEKEAEGDVVLVATCVHLDVSSVLDHLHRMLTAFQPAPRMLVLMGPFCSRPFGASADDRGNFIALLEQLGDMLLSTDAVASGRTRIVLVPSALDPGLGRVLPRPPLPDSFTASLRRRIPAGQLVCASNPCRVRFHTQEAVFFCDDVTSKLHRSALLTPAETSSSSSTLRTAQTLLSQAHLLPLPLTDQPVYWAHDAALRLFPLPDLVILGENAPAFQHHLDGATVVGPGSFAAAHNGDFITWWPSRLANGHDSAIELSRIAPHQPPPPQPPLPENTPPQESPSDKIHKEPRLTQESFQPQHLSPPKHRPMDIDDEEDEEEEDTLAIDES